MKNEKILLFILATAQFTHIIDFMIVMPLGATFIKTLEISPQQFSWIVSAYALAAFVAGLIGATVIDRFDRKTAFLFCYIGFTIGTLACAMAPNYPFLLFTRSLAGIFGGIIGALVLAIVADRVPLPERGRAMGVIMTAFSVASVVGVPSGLFFAAKFGWRAPFIGVGIICLITIGLIIAFVPSMTEHLSSKRPKVEPLKVLQNIYQDRNQLNALIFSLVLMLGHFMIIPFIATYMELNIGFSELQITYIYLIGGTLTAVLLPYFGTLADRIGHQRLFTIASIFALFSIFAITNLPAVPIGIALIATSSFFVVASGRNVPATTMITSVVKPESRASFMSVRSSVNELAFFLSSFIAGMIIEEGSNKELLNYPYVGYIAIIMSVCAIGIARVLKLKA